MAGKRQKQPATAKSVETLKHDDASRKNIPTAEHQSVMEKAQQDPIRVAYERRNRDLDPQLVWRGKDEQDWSDLVVQAPPLYIQEKIHPKVLIDDLRRRSEQQSAQATGAQIDMFADFNGLPDTAAKTEFYQHDAHWSNRMILGDSLQVMASLAEREGLRGKVQCIYFDPPYGIKFNSNFQWSTTSRDVKDGNVDHITREPEQVKAFRDTWRDGIHSYLTYLRDRLTTARDLLTESGSIFVQIGDENVHRIRAVMDEVFGDSNLVAVINFQTAPYATSNYLASVVNVILWYSKSNAPKYRGLFKSKSEIKSLDLYRQALSEDGQTRIILTADETASGPTDRTFRQYRLVSLISQGSASTPQPIEFQQKTYLSPANSHWKVTIDGLHRAMKASRVQSTKASIQFRSFIEDFPVSITNNIWTDTITGSFNDDKVYVVQTNPEVVKRCILMSTDPGDLVLDPTCGSGTTGYVAEQWGRRWITIDTSRVALALARARIMGTRYPFYLLADSPEGQQKEGELNRSAPSTAPTRGNIRHGFVYERVPHVTLKSIANNTEIDVIWEKWQKTLEPIRDELNTLLGTGWKEWEIPRSFGFSIKRDPAAKVVGKIVDAPESERIAKLLSAEQLKRLRADEEKAQAILESWWAARIARQREIDTSIAAKADSEYLYDKPYDDKKKVRVAGPFTVESLSPHRVLGVDENDDLIDHVAEGGDGYGEPKDFATIILENLKMAGVQQAHKEDKIAFTSLVPWPGDFVCAEGRYTESDGKEKRAAIFIGPEFGTVSRPDLVAAAREAGDADFDVLIACAFNYDAHSSEFDKLGRIPVLKARMNADLHMADTLKNTGKGNLFVIFGEPDIDILDAGPDGTPGQIRVKVNGVDVFKPQTGEVVSNGPDDIACWFIDTDYNEESFFVRHAYFLGQNDPYKSLKTTLKAEINEDAWATLHSATSRPFDKPSNGRIAIKVINHLGDEVMKVFRV
jgi:adenine-specific DNA-methyltransferase